MELVPLPDTPRPPAERSTDGAGTARNAGSVPGVPADPLSEVLARLRVRGAVSARFVLGAPWAIRLPRDAQWGVVVLTAGRGVLRDPVHGDRSVDTGDVLLLTRTGERQIGLASAPGVLEVDPDLAFSRDRLGAVDVFRGGDPDGEPTEFVVAAYLVRHGPVDPLLAHLPGVLHLPAAAAGEALTATAALLATELDGPQPGARALLDRLAEVLLVLVLRRWTGRPEAGRPSWLAALADPVLARPLQAMHADPGRAWTVPELAGIAHLSRTQFAHRFTTAVGQPPLAYLTRWRVLLACDRLVDTDDTTAALADRLGYRSAAAFHRTFTRIVGTTPARYRRSRRAAAAAG